MTFLEQINAAREKRGLSIREVQQTLGWPYDTVRKYLMGEREPGPDKLEELARAVGLKRLVVQETKR